MIAMFHRTNPSCVWSSGIRQSRPSAPQPPALRDHRADPPRGTGDQLVGTSVGLAVSTPEKYLKNLKNDSNHLRVPDSTSTVWQYRYLKNTGQPDSSLSKTHVLGCPPSFCKGFLDGLLSPQLWRFQTVYQNFKAHPPSTSQLVWFETLASFPSYQRDKCHSMHLPTAFDPFFGSSS